MSQLRSGLPFKASINLPKGAKKPLAILSENNQDFQSNIPHQDSRQYWAETDPRLGDFSIPRVSEGTYRLTAYAEGIFLDFIKDDIKVSRVGGQFAQRLNWEEESSGKEIWRIGTPDKSAGEYKHGKKPYTEKELALAEFRMYWAQWDFPTDFPDAVKFKVGESDPAEDFNYIHWSVISNVGNMFRSEPYHTNVNNWTILFDLTEQQLTHSRKATLTIQFAGAKTGSRTLEWVNLPYTVNVNAADVETWVIP
jgi:rhamnogalacturonan endolyase